MLSLQRWMQLLFVTGAACSPAPVATPRYSVVINAFDPDGKIQAIKAIREETGLGLADAKSLIERTPCVVRAGLGRAEAEAVAARLRAQRLTVELRREP
jgi:large subunit ribosomal protein L7/L12